MSNNENIQDNQKANNNMIPKIQKDQSQEPSLKDKLLSDNFPKWDILPPNQIINPRLRKTV